MQNNTPKPNNSLNSRWGMINLAFDLGFVIALPLVLFGLLGKYLDAKLGSEPWITLAGIALAITATTIWLTKKIKGYLSK